jgi:hypothetical protein
MVDAELARLGSRIEGNEGDCGHRKESGPVFRLKI